MTFTQRTGGIIKAIAVVLSLALPMMLAASAADARVGGGMSSGSRGTRTFSAPPSTSTTPGATQPLNRTATQPGGIGGTTGGGFFNRPGRGMLGGLAAGFLGAGLFGMLFGGGMFSGLGGISSIFGLLLQIGLIVIVVRLAMSWWQRRHATAPAYAGVAAGPAAGPSTFRSTGGGFGLGSGSAPLEILPADYEAFERLLGEIQAAWSNEDVARLHTLATPEMVSYFTGDLDANKANNQINKVSGTKLLQGDLAEAWREGDVDYASVAMRFQMIDKTVDRTTGRLVTGSEQPTEATEVWTFLRPRGAGWELSAIQQA
jgi:predicted lipid-binding transport protein (Tim44 family)